MDALKIIAENKILQAQSEGVFDELEGKGKPLHLEMAHPTGADQFMANHVLRQNRFLPVWLEDRKILQQLIGACLSAIEEGNTDPDTLQEAVEQLNRRISGYNLRVPVESLRLMPIQIPELKPAKE